MAYTSRCYDCVPPSDFYAPQLNGKLVGVGQDASDPVAAARARGLVWGFLLGAGLMGMMAWASMGAVRR